MAAAVQDNGLGVADLVGQLLGDAGGADRVLVAGDDEGWAVDQPVIGFLGLRQRFARTRKAFRILAHMALTDEGDRDRVVICRRAGERRVGQLIGDRAHALIPRRCRAVAQPCPCRVLWLDDRAKQRETGDTLRLARRQMLSNQSTERMADDVRAVDAKMGGGVFDRLDQELDGDPLGGGGDRPAPGKSGRTMRKPASGGTIA